MLWYLTHGVDRYLHWLGTAAAKKEQWARRAIDLHDSAELVGVLTGKRHYPFLAESLRECFRCRIRLYRPGLLVLVPQRLKLKVYSSVLGWWWQCWYQLPLPQYPIGRIRFLGWYRDAPLKDASMPSAFQQGRAFSQSSIVHRRHIEALTFACATSSNLVEWDAVPSLWSLRLQTLCVIFRISSPQTGNLKFWQTWTTTVFENSLNELSIADYVDMELVLNRGRLTRMSNTGGALPWR